MKTSQGLLLVLVAGCADSYTPGELAGTYGLVAIEGQPPPVLEVATVECDQSIGDGMLLLRSDATHELKLVIESDCTRGGGQLTLVDRVYAGSFGVDGDQLEFVSPHPTPAGNMIFHGRVRGSFVDIDLPSNVVGLDPTLNLRFDARRCTSVCPQP